MGCGVWLNSRIGQTDGRTDELMDGLTDGRTMDASKTFLKLIYLVLFIQTYSNNLNFKIFGKFNFKFGKSETVLMSYGN